MHDRHLARDLSQIERLFDRGVAAADHDHILAAIEKAVAGRAGRDAVAAEGLLGRDAEPARLGPRRDDQSIAGIGRAAVAMEPERALAEFDADDVIGNEMRADVFGLKSHLLHQPRTLDRLGEARIVLDVGRDGQLTAGLKAGDQHRLEQRTGGVDRRRIAGGAGTDDDELGVVGRAAGHRRLYDERS